MVYRKGERTNRQRAADCPHLVVVAIPADGLGKRWPDIQAALVAIAPGVHEHWTELRGLDHRAVYGFRTADQATAFRTWFAERWPGLLEAKALLPPKAEPWPVKRAP